MSKRTRKDSGEERVTAKSKPMMNLVSRCSERNREKSDVLMEVRTVRPVNEQSPGLFTEHTDRFIVDDDDMDSNTVAESDLSSGSRSFLHRVNDRVRKMLDQSSKDATQDSNKHSVIWRIFMSSTLQSICFHGKGILRNFTLHQKKQGTISQ